MDDYRYTFAQPSSPSFPSSNSVTIASDSILDNWRHKQPPRKRYKDELEEFISSTMINVKNPLLWWVQHQQDYPQLSSKY